MNSKAIRVLEYNKILDFLTEMAGSELTRRLIAEMLPMTDERIIREGLEETTEAVTLMTHKGSLPMGNFYDIGDMLSMAKKGGSLSMGQLLKVAYNMKIAEDIVTYLKGDLPPLPSLMAIRDVLETFPKLREEIAGAILFADEMADNASSELKSIRREIVRKNEAIKTKMDHIINSQDNRSALQDSIVTIRDGRYVIPVKAEQKARFPGMVHDQSASGQTLFIEPQVIVNLNNELKELSISEQAEIDRILAEFSSAIGEHAQMLLNNQKLLVQLDLINAKGRLSSAMHGECPEISTEGYMELKEARHPLIDAKNVVPINVSIGDRYKTLIVTGPNTGGKTVTLKTVGLLSLMTQSGLHIPAASTSKMPIFDDVFADIGDEQSIEQSLSTFSSHMVNIVNIVTEAKNKTLVLLDELGAGTDPTEGAALAITVLEELSKRGSFVLATTHYTELKKYALSTEGVENASMEFDVETLSPTYKLSIGIPGKSNAFEIASKLGLRGEMIDKARRLLEGGDLEFEEVLSAIEADKKAAEQERDEAIEINIAMKAEREKLKKDMERLEKERERIIKKAKDEASNILEEATETVKEVKEELRDLAKIESSGERNKRFDRSRRRVKDAAGRYKETLIKEVNDNPISISDVKIGDRVKVMTLGQNGEVLSLPDEKEELLVQVGMMKVKAKAEDLMFIPDSAPKKKSGANYGALYRAKAHSVEQTIDVRGSNMNTACDDVEKYLDDAFMASAGEVTIIHGRGEGILKKGIHAMLSKHKHVVEFREGTHHEGGDGVTIVKLK